jgi:hypothetical protein
MSKEGDEPDFSPPRSMIDPNELLSRSESVRNGNGVLYSPTPRSQRSARLELADHDEDGDAASDIQQGLRSEAGDTFLPVVRHQPINILCCAQVLLTTLTPSANPVHTTFQVLNMNHMILGRPLAILVLYPRMTTFRPPTTVHHLHTTLGMYVIL